MSHRDTSREPNLQDITDRSRFYREVRAEVMLLCPEYAFAYGELIEAEIEYEKVRNCKKSNPPAFYPARDRVLECRKVAGRLYHQHEDNAFLVVWKRHEAKKPKVTDSPEAFAAWVRKQMIDHRRAKVRPEELSTLSVNIYSAAVRQELERRYCLYAYLWRVLQEDGVEASMGVYNEEVKERLDESLTETIAVDKREGDETTRRRTHGKFDGGGYEFHQEAPADLHFLTDSSAEFIKRQKDTLAARITQDRELNRWDDRPQTRIA